MVQVIFHERLQQRTVVPQIQEQIIANLQVTPRELFLEHLDEWVVLMRCCPCSAYSCE